MDYLAHLMPALAPSLAWALIDFAWQGVLVGCAAALLLALMRSARPQARYLVGCLALLACLVLPVAGVMQRLADAAAARPVTTTTLASFAIPAAAPLTEASIAQPRQAGPGWHAALQAHLPLVTTAWACGVAVLALRMLLGLAWVRSRSMEAAMRSEPALAAAARRLAAAFGIRREVRIGLAGGIDGPVTAGWWRPIVLVPAALAARMPPELLEALLAHELAHIRRHDYLVNLVQGAIEIVLFYHPAVWWLSARVRHEREQVADDLAASVLGEPRRLALALSELDLVRLDQPQLAPAAHGGHLMSRIKRLVRPTREPLNWKIAVPILGLAAACAGLYANAAQPPAPAPAAAAAPAPAKAVQPAPAAPAAKRHREERHPAFSGEGYAIVREADKGKHITVHGGGRADIEAARSAIKGDFIWFRHDGEPYVIEDPALVARAVQAWAPMDALGKEMEAHGAQMEKHGKVMEALGTKMAAAASKRAKPAREQELAFRQRIDALAARRAELAAQAAAAQRDIDAQEGRDRSEQRAKLEAMRAQEDAVEAQIAAASAGFEAEHLIDEEAMESVGREMEKAGEPMEALGAKMEALGERMKEQGKVSDKAMRALIGDALASGKARPAPRG